MDVPIWLLVLLTVLWLTVFMLHALRFAGSTLSRFELARRAESGDAIAQKEREKEMLLPRLMTLRALTIAVLTVLATSLAIVAFGWLGGTLIATALVLLTGIVQRLGILRRAATTLYSGREAGLMHLVHDWAWLDWLRGFEQQSPDAVAASKAELRHIVERSAAVLAHDERLRLQAGLSFDDHTVEDVMTPISVVDTVNESDGLGPMVLDELHRTGHSRFPVIGSDIHHVVGMLYLCDIINLKSSKASVREAMEAKVHYIHENQTLEHALNGFLRTHHHLFIVVNDYRETVGVLALEDVLEAMLGKKIVDEFDQYEDLRAVAESNPRKNNVPKGKTDI